MLYTRHLIRSLCTSVRQGHGLIALVPTGAVVEVISLLWNRVQQNSTAAFVGTKAISVPSSNNSAASLLSLRISAIPSFSYFLSNLSGLGEAQLRSSHFIAVLISCRIVIDDSKQ